MSRRAVHNFHVASNPWPVGMIVEGSHKVSPDGKSCLPCDGSEHLASALPVLATQLLPFNYSNFKDIQTHELEFYKCDGYGGDFIFLHNKGVYSSRDNGLTLDSMSGVPINSSGAYYDCAMGDGVFYVCGVDTGGTTGSHAVVARSIDGKTFDKFFKQGHVGNFGPRFTRVAASGSNAFVIGQGNSLNYLQFYTSDKGATWNRGEGTYERTPRDVDMQGSIGLVANGGLRRSTDGGKSWSSVDLSGLGLGSVTRCRMTANKTVLASSSRVAVSMDHGATFALTPLVLPDSTPIIDIAISGAGAIFVATGEYVYISDDDFVTVNKTTLSSSATSISCGHDIAVVSGKKVLRAEKQPHTFTLPYIPALAGEARARIVAG